MALIHRVNERDEPPRPISFPMAHAGDVGDDEGVVGAHHLDVVGGARGAADELVEGEAAGAAGGQRDLDVAAPDGDGGRVGRVGVGRAEEGEPFVGVGGRGFVEGVVVDCESKCQSEIVEIGVVEAEGKEGKGRETYLLKAVVAVYDNRSVNRD